MYTDTYSQAEETMFRQQCQIALIQSAINISSEDGQTPNHANRVGLAYQVLREPARHTALMSYAIAQFAAGETDADISNAIGGIWDAYANAAASVETT